MINTILVTGAGSGGAENLIRSITDINKHVKVIGTNSNKLLLLASQADHRYNIVHSIDSEYIPQINEIIEKHDVDLIIPNNDKEVRAISANRDMIKPNLFLPRHKDIVGCQDKFILHAKIPLYTPITKKFTVATDFTDKWIKLRRGSGSMASLPVRNKEEATNWVSWWVNHRGQEESNFLVCDLLPGRDFAVQSIWRDGTCVLIKAVQRLSYIFAKNMPQNSSSSPSIAMQIYDKEVIDTCIKAITAINNKANGIWSIDLKEDQYGIPRVNEINIGRFCMISPIFNHGKHNMVKTYIDCAMGKEVLPEKDLGTDITNVVMIRELDTNPFFIFPEDPAEEMAQIYGDEHIYGTRSKRT